MSQTKKIMPAKLLLQAQEWTQMFHFFSGVVRLFRSRRTVTLWMKGFIFPLFTAGVMQNEHCPKYEILGLGLHDSSVSKTLQACWAVILHPLNSFCVQNKHTINAIRLREGVKCKTSSFSFCYACLLVPWPHISVCPSVSDAISLPVCLIDCIRRLIGHSARGWISSRAASPPAASSIELHSPGDAPLPCSGFHRPAAPPSRSPFRYRDFFHKRLMDKKHVRKQLLYSAVRRARPLFITCIYIFYKKKNVVDECLVWLLLEWNRKYPPVGS